MNPEIPTVDWSTWTPTMRATLLFVRRGDELLLIRKKRGLGAGKINAPGGRIEPGESAAECAIREVIEELGVTALAVDERGELSFQFVDGLALHVRVFVADRFTGDPVETDEAIPLWTPVHAIPFDEMWADDQVWMPALLAGQRFALRAIFDGDAMLDHALELDLDRA